MWGDLQSVKTGKSSQSFLVDQFFLARHTGQEPPMRAWCKNKQGTPKKRREVNNNNNTITCSSFVLSFLFFLCLPFLLLFLVLDSSRAEQTKYVCGPPTHRFKNPARSASAPAADVEMVNTYRPISPSANSLPLASPHTTRKSRAWC